MKSECTIRRQQHRIITVSNNVFVNMTQFIELIVTMVFIYYLPAELQSWTKLVASKA